MRRFQNASDNSKIEWAFFVPEQLREFAHIYKSSRFSSNRIGSILVMGSKISGDEKSSIAELFKCNVIESWGNTESLGTITEASDLSTRPESIGRPFLSDSLFIVDENGNRMGSKTVGKIAGAQEGGFTAYSNKLKETNRVLQHGMIISDDLGYTDEAGYFYILGRESDEIEIGGNSYSISEIENAVRMTKYINDCCVIPQTRDSDEKILICAVVIHQDWSSISSSDLCELISSDLPEGVIISEVHFLEKLPKLPSGKLDRLSITNQLCNNE